MQGGSEGLAQRMEFLDGCERESHKTKGAATAKALGWQGQGHGQPGHYSRGSSGEASLDRKGSQSHRQGNALSFHLELKGKQCRQISGSHLSNTLELSKLLREEIPQTNQW